RLQRLQRPLVGVGGDVGQRRVERVLDGRQLGRTGDLANLALIAEREGADAARCALQGVHGIAPAVLFRPQHRAPNRRLLAEQRPHLVDQRLIARRKAFQVTEIHRPRDVAPRHADSLRPRSPPCLVDAHGGGDKMSEGSYEVYGALGSPYSLKMRAVMRYRRLPHSWSSVGLNPEVRSKVKVPVIPVIRFGPDDW